MVRQPIIIVGTGRCGSTIFQQVLSEHPEIAWLSSVYDWYPRVPAINQVLMKVVDYPLIGNYLKRQKVFRPWEPYAIWDRHYPGFSRPFRDLRVDDVTPLAKKRFHKIAAQMVTPKRHRLMIKITGWPRLRFLAEIFPDAKFIHVVRDGRAVVNSMLNVKWWTGWKGPTNWGWGELNETEKAQLAKYRQSFIALASVEWNHLIRAMATAKQEIDPNNFLEMRYEDFCENVVGAMYDVAAYCHLSWHDRIAAAVGAYQISEKNYKWQEELTPAQQAMMNDIMACYLKQYHYV